MSPPTSTRPAENTSLKRYSARRVSSARSGADAGRTLRVQRLVVVAQRGEKVGRRARDERGEQEQHPKQRSHAASRR